MQLEVMKDNCMELGAVIWVVVLCHVIALGIEYTNLKRRDVVVNIIEFKNYVGIQLMAFLFSVVYVICDDYLKNGKLGWIPVVLFYGFIIKITMEQNKTSGGYITSWNGCSGTLLFISATLRPFLFIIIYGTIILWQFWMINRDGDSLYISKRKKQIVIRMFDIFEAIVLWGITVLVPKDKFLDKLQWNAVLISIFTVILPLLNVKILDLIWKRLD